MLNSFNLSLFYRSIWTNTVRIFAYKTDWTIGHLSSDQTYLSVLYASVFVTLRSETTHHLSTHGYQIFPVSRLFTFVSVLIRCLHPPSFSLRSFKCANSLTVHRRRLHLLPLMDKANDHGDHASSSQLNEKPPVRSGAFHSICSRKHCLFSRSTSMPAISANDVSLGERSWLAISWRSINWAKQSDARDWGWCSFSRFLT